MGYFLQKELVSKLMKSGLLHDRTPAVNPHQSHIKSLEIGALCNVMMCS